ncbi:hypothetical protein CDIK_0374 [Cucumispora dikerogammari]|nr:hypothetical protein CDIK_0374 [Cucumispora dikerogammari]
MLTSILANLKVNLCDQTESPIIVTQPNIVQSKKNSFSGCLSKNLQKSNFIETIIDFKNPSNYKEFEVTPDTIINNLKCLFVDTIEGPDNKLLFNKNLAFSEDLNNNFKSLGVKLTQIKRTSKFKILIQPDHKENENLLIKYMEDNPTKLLKLVFIFPGPIFKPLDDIVSDILFKIFNKTDPITEYMENTIAGVYDSLNDSFETISKPETTLDERETTIMNISQKIEQTINTISGDAKLIDKIKWVVTDYFNKQDKKFSDVVDFGVGVKDLSTIADLHSECKHAYIELKNEIKDILKSIIESEVDQAKTTIYHKDIIKTAFIKEVDSYGKEDLMSLTNITSNIKEKKETLSKFLIIESSILQLNSKTGQLEEIKKSEKDNVSDSLISESEKEKVSDDLPELSEKEDLQSLDSLDEEDCLDTEDITKKQEYTVYEESLINKTGQPGGSKMLNSENVIGPLTSEGEEKNDLTGLIDSVDNESFETEKLVEKDSLFDTKKNECTVTEQSSINKTETSSEQSSNSEKDAEDKQDCLSDGIDMSKPSPLESNFPFEPRNDVTHV